jgi:hypothetical protein
LIYLEFFQEICNFDDFLPKTQNMSILTKIDLNIFSEAALLLVLTHYYPLANEVAKGYSNAIVRPSVTSL